MSENVSRRELLSKLGSGVVVGSSLVLFGGYMRKIVTNFFGAKKLGEWQDYHQGKYGTLDNPIYIMLEKEDTLYPTSMQEIQSLVTTEFKRLESELNTLNEELPDRYKQYVEQAKKEYYTTLLPNSKKARKLEGDYYDSLSKLRNNLTYIDFILKFISGEKKELYMFPEYDKLAEILSISVSEKTASTTEELTEILEREYAQISNQIFMKITGKPYNGKTVYVPNNSGGTHYAQRDTIEIDKRSNLIPQIITSFHELGHVAYQGLETQSFINQKGELPWYNEIRIMEEAAAYLFTFAGINEVKKIVPAYGRGLALEFLNDRFNLLKDFAAGSDEWHDCGMALAEALLISFNNDYAKAFNHLSTMDGFLQLSRDVMRNYVSLRKSYPDKALKDRGNEIREKYSLLKERYGLLLNQPRPMDIFKIMGN